MSDKFEMTFLRNDDSKRPETGPCQANDDWPGVFIRGDNASNFSLWLREIIEDFEAGKPVNAFAISILKGLASTLESCDVRNLNSQSPTKS